MSYLFIFRFGFKSGIWILIAPVPVHCFSITFTTINGTYSYIVFKFNFLLSAKIILTSDKYWLLEWRFYFVTLSYFDVV